MDRDRTGLSGVLAGWAVGIWESGLALADAGTVGNVLIYPLAPMVVMGIYGWLGWSIARFSPIRVKWTIAIPLASALVLALHLHFLQPSLAGGWKTTGMGTLGGLLLWRKTLRPTRHGRGLVLAGILMPVIPLAAVGLALVLQGQPRPLEAALPPAPDSERPNVVLVTWDTVRADTLPAFGGGGGGGGLDTPSFDALAARGVLLEDLLAVAPLTGPSHASILSGLYPPSHGLRANGQTLEPDGLPWLPRLLGEAGYATGAFVSGYPVRAKFGFASGFQHFDDRVFVPAYGRLLKLVQFSSILVRLVVPVREQDGLTVDGQESVTRALAWYRAQPRPTFLWVHLFDAHGPYAPPEPFRAAALARGGGGPQAVNPECHDALVAQRGEVAWLDHLLGVLLAGLEQRDTSLRRTLVVLSADHGECFGEAGLDCTHEGSLDPATQRVPALLLLPAQDEQARRGVRYGAPLSHVDLLPTICEAVGVPAPRSVQGRSFLAALRGAHSAAGSADTGRYMESWQARLGHPRRSGWVKDGWQVEWTPDGELYALHRFAGADAADWSRRERELARTLLAEGQNFTARLAQRRATRGTEAIDAAALRELGYTSAETAVED